MYCRVKINWVDTFTGGDLGDEKYGFRKERVYGPDVYIRIILKGNSWRRDGFIAGCYMGIELKNTWLKI